MRSGHGLPAMPPLMDVKATTQHAEIQRLLTENQRLTATHIALRQELAAAQHQLRDFSASHRWSARWTASGQGQQVTMSITTSRRTVAVEPTSDISQTAA